MRIGKPGSRTRPISSTDTLRARLTRTCSNTARHLLDDSETATQALTCDLVEAAELVPNASLEWLASALPMLSEARREAALAEALRLRADAE